MTDIARSPAVRVAVQEPAYQAYQILHWGLTIAPILFGLDKFFHVLVNWDQYLAPIVSRWVGGNGHAFMLAAGVVEIIAGLLVAFKPRIGGYVLAIWLLGVIVNLLIYSGFYDIALRDFGLLLGALALARLSQEFERA